MRKVMLAIVFTLSGSVLTGCHTPPQTSDQAFMPMEQYYHGTLPGYNREAIEASLFLDRDGTFVLQQYHNNGARGSRVQYSAGQWARTADKLTLVENTTGKKQFFRPAGSSLEMLDINGVADASSGCRFMLSPQDKPLTT